MWPWKLESFKECVTTHSPNLKVLKIDNAKINYLYFINITFFLIERNIM